MWLTETPQGRILLGSGIATAGVLILMITKPWEHGFDISFSDSGSPDDADTPKSDHDVKGPPSRSPEEIKEEFQDADKKELEGIKESSRQNQNNIKGIIKEGQAKGTLTPEQIANYEKELRESEKFDKVLDELIKEKSQKPGPTFR